MRATVYLVQNNINFKRRGQKACGVFFIVDKGSAMWYYVEVVGGVWICLQKKDKTLYTK